MANVLKLAPAKKAHIFEPSRQQWLNTTSHQLTEKGFRTTGSESVDKMLQLPYAARKNPPIMATVIESEEAPQNCDICEASITTEFVDGAIRNGPWGNLCMKCHQICGIGLGTGLGQHYLRSEDGNFHKVEGPQNKRF